MTRACAVVFASESMARSVVAVALGLCACQPVTFDDVDGEVTTTGVDCQRAWAQSIHGPRGDRDTEVDVASLEPVVGNAGHEGWLVSGRFDNFARLGDLPTELAAAGHEGYVAQIGSDGDAQWFTRLGPDLFPISATSARGGVLVLAAYGTAVNEDFGQLPNPGATAAVAILVSGDGTPQSMVPFDPGAIGFELRPSAGHLEPEGWIGGTRNVEHGEPGYRDDYSVVELMRVGPDLAPMARVSFEPLEPGNVRLGALRTMGDQVAVVLTAETAMQVGGVTYAGARSSNAIVVMLDGDGQVLWSRRVESEADGAVSDMQVEFDARAPGTLWVAFAAEQGARIGGQSIELPQGLSTVVARIEYGTMTHRFVVEPDNYLSEAVPVALVQHTDGDVSVLGSLTGEVHVGSVPATSWPPQRNSWLLGLDDEANFEHASLGNHRASSVRQSNLTPARLAAVGDQVVQAGTLVGRARWDDAELNFQSSRGVYVVGGSTLGEVSCN